MTTSFATYTFEDCKTAAGILKVYIYVFKESPPADQNVEWLFAPFKVEETIEDTANVFKIANNKFTAWNKGDIFKTIFNYSDATILDARIRVDLTHASGTENIYYGVIDPATIIWNTGKGEVEFGTYSLLDRLNGFVDRTGTPVEYGLTVKAVKEYLNGTRILAKTSGSHVTGNTTINVQLNSIQTGIPVNTVIVISGSSYTVTTNNVSSIVITPGLTGNVSNNTSITPPDYRISYGGNNHVQIYNIFLALRVLLGCSSNLVTVNRLRFKRSGGGATEYYYYGDLVILFDNYFYETNPIPAESFMSYDASVGAIGLLKALCYGFMLFAEIQYDDSTGAGKLIAQHRNNPAGSTPTLENKCLESSETIDWINVYNEFEIAYATGQTYVPGASYPLTRTLKKKLSTQIPWGQEGSANGYRLLIYTGGVVHEITNTVAYLQAPDDTTWITGGNIWHCIYGMLTDMFRCTNGLKREKKETYATVLGKISGAYSVNNIRLGMNVSDYRIKKIVRDPFANETEIVRVKR